VSPNENELLCDNWFWDPTLKELRYHKRRRKSWEDEPESVERLQPVASVTWYRWSQTPMASSTGQMMTGQMSRVVAAYLGGGNLTLNESDRSCAEKLALAIAGAYGLAVIEDGAPDGRRGGNLPARDQMGRLVHRARHLDIMLDEVGGEITVAKARFPAGKTRRTIRTSEVRRLELTHEVKGPMETFTVWAVAGPDEERLPLASYDGYEGWADDAEWKEFTQELARSLGVPAIV